jgi:hypothetical protein
MHPNHRSTDLAAVEYSIAQVTQRIEVLDERIDTGMDELDRNAQDERRDLQRQRDQLELQRDQLELRLPAVPFTGTLSNAQAQARHLGAHREAWAMTTGQEAASVTEPSCDGSTYPSQASIGAACDGVTDQKPPSSEAESVDDAAPANMAPPAPVDVGEEETK